MTVRCVREGLRAVLHQHAGHEVPPEALRALNGALADVTLRAEFDDGGYRLVAVAGGAARVVAGILDAVRRSAEEGTWDRLKVCERDSCRWAFFDESRNHARRWCSMAGCGNHIKMQRSSAARKARAGSGDRT